MTTTSRSRTAHLEQVEAPGSLLTTAAARALAVLRVTTGLVFLWAFLDKTFGFGYATPAAKAWVNGGSPTKGFLASVEAGPFQSLFHNLAGTTFADVAFMLGMLGVGMALILGIGLRVGAGAATALMAMMWLAEWPLAKGSSNPLIDYHVIYAISAILCALTYAGHTWGLGRWWVKLPTIQKNRWLI